MDSILMGLVQIGVLGFTLKTPTEIITENEYISDNFRRAGFVESDPFSEPSASPSAIDEKIIAFRDLIREVDME